MQKIHLFARELISPSHREYEALYIFLGLTLGVSSVFYFLTPYCWLILGTFLLFLFFANKKGRKVLLLYLIAFFIGAIFLLCLSFPSRGTGEYSGLVIDSKDNYFILWTFKGRYYVYSYDHAYEIGDILNIYGKAEEFSSTSYEGRFYFPEYLAKRGISSRLYPYDVNSLWSFPFRIRDRQEEFLSSFSPLAKGLIDSLLFDRKDYDNDIISLSSSLGALYFLSSSGLVFQAFLFLFSYLLSLKIEKKKAQKWTFFFSLILLPLYLRKIGVWRVVLTRGLSLFIDKKGYRKPLRVDLVSYAGLTMLLLDPFMGLQSSFLIGYGLSLLLPLSSGFLNRYEGRRKKITTSFLVLFFLFPVFLTGNSFHLLSPIYSFIFKPLTLPFAFLSLISYLINVPFIALLNGYSGFIYGCLNVFSYADVIIPFGDFSGFVIYFYYLILISIIYFLEIGFPLPANFLNHLLLIMNLVRIFAPMNLVSASITFINVGQGDSILIRDGYNAVLIDTGGNISFDMAEEVLIPYFRKIGLYHLDALITTHDDYDHSGAANSLISTLWVDEWISEPSSFPYKKGNIVLDNLNIYSYSSTEENDNSLVLYSEFIGRKWLFMGDAPSSIEMEIAGDNQNLDCDVLKIGHHGSNTSTSEDFLDLVTPEEAIISVGKNNTYGHPHEEILERLSERGIKIRRTDIEGSITYSTLRSFSS